MLSLSKHLNTKEQLLNLRALKLNESFGITIRMETAFLTFDLFTKTEIQSLKLVMLKKTRSKRNCILKQKNFWTMKE